MNSYKYIITVILLCGLASCGSDCKTEYYHSNHFIDCYRDWSSVDLQSHDVLYVCFDSKSNYYYSEEVQISFKKNQSENDLKRFNKLAEKNNDNGYSYKASYFPGEAFRTTLAKGFTDINITSDRDYDNAHPVGASLNDIFIIATYSYAQFLNGSNKAVSDPDDRTLGMIYKPCNELGHDDLLLVSPDIILIPTQTSSGKHNITVTLTDENGEVHTATAEKDFSDR